ncbi:aspartate/glutamate racemase family protein [Actinospica durhamensis]|uniref:Aspartate/glutamate racemase family protein n=1 Tax=Actinospica durhamensis TaxID=1508375 RepID=A0A941EG16_9ACTN|nr:aspartate/glutamate racemase family protein [Actinospica durhamensis]MBR7831965.1 aspartate/glutamate racemase family protein [Actinospica durhamensis]
MMLDGETPAVAVIAGTPFDAGLGAELLRAKGLAAVPYGMANTPHEQDSMQYQDPRGLAAAFHARLHGLHARGTELAMLFCNSMSAVVDHDKAALPVISPIAVYREVFPELRSSLVITGNAQALVGVERTTWQVSPGHRMVGLSDPALVSGIETGDPEAAFTHSHLPTTLRLAQRLDLDAVVLACTHFTTILPLITAACDLPVIDVGTRLVELATLAVTGSQIPG